MPDNQDHGSGAVSPSVPNTRFFGIYWWLALLLSATEVSAMSLFSAGKVCTFSGISGVILQGGVPVANAKVTRTTTYRKKRTDHTVTSKEGFFWLPALFEHSVLALLPQEFAVGQLLTVTINGVDHVIWDGVKRIKDENAEADGQATGRGL